MTVENEETERRGDGSERGGREHRAAKSQPTKQA